MYDAAVQQTRRSRKVFFLSRRHTQSVKPVDAEESKAEESKSGKPAKPRSVIRLPTFHPWRFYNA